MVACEKCIRNKQCRQVVLPDIHYSGERPDVFCLGESPGFNEDVQGKPFIGMAGDVLHAILREVTNEYILDNPTRCFADHKPKMDELMACKSNWIAVVKKHKPKVIVALGNYAILAILNKEIKIGKCVGQTTTVNIGGSDYPLVFSYHPSYIMRDAKERKKGGEKAFEAWINTWTLVDSLIHGRMEKIPETLQLTEHHDVICFLRWLNEKYNGMIAYDYEAIGDRGALRPELCESFKIVSVGIGIEEGCTEYDKPGISFPFDTKDRDVSPDIQHIWEEIITKPNISKIYQRVAQNAKYEHKCNLKRFGFTGYLHDTMLAMNVINELAPANLGAIGGYCKIPWSGYKFDMADAQRGPLDVPIDRLLKYSALEGALTYKVWIILSNEINAKVDSVNRNKVLQMQQNFAFHLAHVEMNGMHIDQQEVVRVRSEVNALLNEAKGELLGLDAVKKTEKWAKQNIKSFKDEHHFNPKSAPQVHHLVLKVLKVPVKLPKYSKKPKEGEEVKIALDKDVLSRYEEDFPVLKSLLKVRSLSAMMSSFLDKYEDFTGPDGCVHTNYTQEIVVTGRLSSTKPNLQNIPLDSIIRKIFDSRYKNGWLVAADYIQLEPILLAGWSADREMCKALNDGKDLHRFVGSKIYNVDYDAVTEKQRWIAKRRNLGSMYGQTAEGLAEAANIPLKEAQRIIDVYDKSFPGVKRFRIDRGREASRTGRVVDLFGAVRHLRDAQSNDISKKSRAWRQAGNFPIQSTGNRFHLIAMCIERDYILQQNIKAVVVGVEHDKIYVDCANDALGVTIDTMVKAMLIHNEARYWRDKLVPVKVDVKYGKNMYEMKEWSLKT